MKYLDTKTKKIETLLDKTSSSFLMTQTKLSNKGINCDHWFSFKDFNERFKKIEND